MRSYFDINDITVSGRLTRDAQLKYTNNGYPICFMDIANNYQRKVGDNYEKDANFITIKMFGKLGELMGELGKGEMVVVNGQIREERWETEGGQKRSKIVVIAESVVRLNGSQKGSKSGGNQSSYDDDVLF